MIRDIRVLARRMFVVAALASISSAARGAQNSPPANDTSDKSATVETSSVEQVYERARPALAVISVRGNDGRQRGLGSGFVVAADGLIATNLHVIGENRAIDVQLADGERYEVTAIHAFDRFLDLAILRVDAAGLKPLPIGDSEALRQGQAVVALGNPQGLRHSVVSGVVSGKREIDERSMIQLAIPVEQGNSGGPLLDMHGQVAGIITAKSTVTANLGFAVAINDLKPLLAKPNPVPIKRWVKQSLVDPRQWQTVLGGNWRTHGGRILVDGEGDGFGGRALCLSNQVPPRSPVRGQRLGAAGRRIGRGRAGLRGRRR